MTTSNQRYGISGSTLKLIAIITMLIDHTGATILRTMMNYANSNGTDAQALFWSTAYKYSRNIGRLAFPIFCFFIVEGALHTRSKAKYAGRLFLFALISEIPFDRALKNAWIFPHKQNVYFTLLIGLLVIIAIDILTKDMTRWQITAILPIAAGMKLATMINSDYNFKGVFMIAVLYLLKSSKLPQCIGGAMACAWELPAPLTFLFVYFYNGMRGKQMKYFFYLFYPCHLMLLYCANLALRLVLY